MANVKIAAKKTEPDWGNFTEVEDVPHHRLIFRSFGAEKVGKDHFGLTMPGPIAIQSFDIGLEGVVEKFLRAPLGPKQIMKCEYQFDKNNASQDDAIALKERFVEDFEAALKVARSIIWDTESEVWEVFRFAVLGGASAAPNQYVELNAEYRDLIQKAYDADVNLQLIQKIKEKWVTVVVADKNGNHKEKGRPSGQFEASGFKEAHYIVQANIEHKWDKERGFIINVINCRQNMAVAGEEFENSDFPTLAQMIFPETEAEEWA